MIQKDYFMKIAQMLATVIAKIALKKEQKLYDDAEKEIEEAALSIAGIDLKLIKMFSEEDLIKLIKTSDLYAGKCIAAAELLNEHGKLKELTGKSAECGDSYKKSLRLYIEAVLSKDLPDNSVYGLKIEELSSKIRKAEYSNEINLRLLDYYAFTNQFSKYEDTAFELIENSNDAYNDFELNELYSKIIGFYNKLKTLPEEELLKGNFSKTEVDEGLEEILYLQKQK